MLKKIALAIAVFLIILVALTFGENVVHQALAWFTHLTGIVFHNFSDLYWAVHDYVVRHSTILYAFAPLVVALSLIDAVRYLFMTDEDFALPVVRR